MEKIFDAIDSDEECKKIYDSYMEQNPHPETMVLKYPHIHWLTKKKSYKTLTLTTKTGEPYVADVGKMTIVFFAAVLVFIVFCLALTEFSTAVLDALVMIENQK